MQRTLLQPGVGLKPTKLAAGGRAAACAPRPFTPGRSYLRSQDSRGDQRSVAARSQPENQFDVDTGSAEQLPVELGPRLDDMLPDSLADAVSQAADATAAAINGGINRCQVEIHLPEFWDPISGPIFPNRGDQERFWRMTRRFVEALAAQTGSTSVKAVYPDAGVAAMLTSQWNDKTFAVDSLNARRPVTSEDELVVICCPDPFAAEECQRTVRQVAEQDAKAGVMERPVVLFNQRMSSGDVGIGLNARRLRENFLKRFNVTYSLRPVGDVGTVFRRYPGLWMVFVEEADLPGRYRMVKEQPNRPAGEALDEIIMQALDPAAAAAAADGQPQQKGLLESIGSTMAGMQRFMRSLSQ
ncbi:hypothetical protein COO60DRAFT_1024742 [Scenedesmus sp. NREL 46B-D3]|nr:hypothetical protein COO60DRAFT_1024742 [Scenedesmus sp. NREL 46B-D3]